MSCVAGRAVAKKGYDTLLSALSAIPPDINWRFVHQFLTLAVGMIRESALGHEQTKHAAGIGVRFTPLSGNQTILFPAALAHEPLPQDRSLHLPS